MIIFILCTNKFIMLKFINNLMRKFAVIILNFNYFINFVNYFLNFITTIFVNLKFHNNYSNVECCYTSLRQ